MHSSSGHSTCRTRRRLTSGKRLATERREKEIQDAKEQQKHARLLLRQVAFQEEDLMDVEEEAEEEDDDWARMIRDWEEENEMADDGVLQRALQESRSRTPRPATRGPSRSPGMTRLEDTQPTGPSRSTAYNACSPTLRNARSDPYTWRCHRGTAWRPQTRMRPPFRQKAVRRRGKATLRYLLDREMLPARESRKLPRRSLGDLLPTGIWQRNYRRSGTP